MTAGANYRLIISHLTIHNCTNSQLLMVAMAADTDPIRHVVMLVLENHSFDQMLGCLSAVHPGLEGIDPANPRTNSDVDGVPVPQSSTMERQMLLDPHHE